jgi:hypothetical protein
MVWMKNVLGCINGFTRSPLPGTRRLRAALTPAAALRLGPNRFHDPSDGWGPRPGGTASRSNLLATCSRRRRFRSGLRLARSRVPISASRFFRYLYNHTPPVFNRID